MKDRSNPPTAEEPAPGPKKRSVVNLVEKTGFTALLVLMAFTIFLGASHEGRAAVKATLFIPHVFNASIKPLNWFTPTPVVERVTFPIPGGAGAGDIYRPPGEGPYAAVLLFLGVAPAGHDDPRVVRLGDALARSNMVTLFYWSPIMAEGRMEPEDVDNLVAAFQYLSAQDYVDATRVGMGGFCVGASFSIMAASAEPIRDQVAFVNAFGPYFDMRDLIGAISSGTKSYGVETLSWEPDKLSRKVFITHLTQDLPETESRLLQNAFLDNASPEIAVQDLSPQGKAVYNLLKGVPQEEVKTHLAQIPQRTQERAALISPSQRLDGLRTPLLIMHDREDDLVPAFESRRLLDALKHRGNARYTEFGLFDHVTPDIRLGLWDTSKELVKLFRHLHSILMKAT